MPEPPNIIGMEPFADWEIPDLYATVRDGVRVAAAALDESSGVWKQERTGGGPTAPRQAQIIGNQVRASLNRTQPPSMRQVLAGAVMPVTPFELVFQDDGADPRIDDVFTDRTGIKVIVVEVTRTREGYIKAGVRRT